MSEQERVLTKAEAERRRLYPITERAHTLTELATLLSEGKTYREIAALWGMRPQAGTRDLEYDVWIAWENAGCPCGLPEPGGYSKEYEDQWEAWRNARETAIPDWLESIRTGRAFQSRADLEARLAAAEQERDELKALLLAENGVLIGAPAMAVVERERAEAAEYALNAATRLAESRAVEIAELRAALLAVAKTAPTLSKVRGLDVHRVAVGYHEWRALMDLLNRPADVRGTEILAAADEMAECLEDSLVNLAEWEHSSKEDALERYRALVGGAGTEE